MSIKIMSRIWEGGPAAQADRFIMLALADYANDAGECWPSIRGIATKVCMSERGVQVAIRRLEVAGWLEIQTGNGRKGCNQYVIKTPQQVHPSQCENPAPAAPRTSCTPQMKVKTPQMDAQNPAPAAPEPSITINNHQQQLRDEVKDEATDRERLLSSMGLDPSGMSGPNGKRLGTMADMEIAAKWLEKLTIDDQCKLIVEKVAAAKAKSPGFAPRSFAYFTAAMADFAALKAQPMPQGVASGAKSGRDAQIARWAALGKKSA